MFVREHREQEFMLAEREKRKKTQKLNNITRISSRSCLGHENHHHNFLCFEDGVKKADENKTKIIFERKKEDHLLLEENSAAIHEKFHAFGATD